MRDNIITIMFLAIFVLVFYLLFRIFKPFLISLFWGGLIAMIMYPFYSFAGRWFRGRENLLSVLLTVLVSLLIIIPSLLLIFFLAVEAIEAYNQYRDTLLAIDFSSLLERFRGTSIGRIMFKFFEPGSVEQTEALLVKLAGKASGFLWEQAQSLVRNISLFLFKFAITLISIFFFFRDGNNIVNNTKDLLPLPERTKTYLIKRLHETLSAVVNGMVLTAIAQGILLAIGFWIFGIPYPILFGALTAILAFLPFLGAAVVWVPAGVYLMLDGSIGAGIGVLIWGALLVSAIENFLKPFLIGGRTHLPLLFLFLSILGGIRLFGITGVFLGPVLLAIFIALAQIYIEEFRGA